ncbi:MAG: 50S ribosomal protein L24 [Pseudomonadota bacterium]
MMKIRKGDEVVVITGKDKGRQGIVLQVIDQDRLIVEGINIAKKHQKGNPQVGEPGGIIDKAMPIHISNVMLYNPKTQKGDRVGVRTEDGTKVRFFKSNNETV